MRLIDADAAVERLQRRSDMFRFDKRYEAVMRDAIGEVLTMPTIDAVPVVRCKDCQYAFRNHGHDKDGCPIEDRRIWMDGDGFCSEGKRKKKEEHE